MYSTDSMAQERHRLTLINCEQLYTRKGYITCAFVNGYGFVRWCVSCMLTTISHMLFCIVGIMQCS